MVSMPRCGCHGKPARYSRGTSLRKSSSSRKGSKSDVLPKPNARRRCTPAPSRVGLAFTRRFTGRMDIPKVYKTHDKLWKKTFRGFVQFMVGTLTSREISAETIESCRRGDRE